MELFSISPILIKPLLIKLRLIMRCLLFTNSGLRLKIIIGKYKNAILSYINATRVGNRLFSAKLAI